MHREHMFGLIVASLAVLLTPSLAFAEIPDWVKINAGWWADGSVGDATFVDALEYLIGQGVIAVDNCADLVNAESPGDASEIPDWVKINAGWWADGSVGDATFVDALEYLIGQGVIAVDNCADLVNAESPGDASDMASPEPPVSIEWIKQHMTWGPSLVSIDEFIERHPYHPKIIKSYIDTELAKQKEWAEYNNKEFVPANVTASESDIYNYLSFKTSQKAGIEYVNNRISIVMDDPTDEHSVSSPSNVIKTNGDDIRHGPLVAYAMDRQYVDGYKHTYTQHDPYAGLFGSSYKTRDHGSFPSGVPISIDKVGDATIPPFTITDSNGKTVDVGDGLYSGQYTVEFDESVQKRVGSVSPYSYEPFVLTFTVVELPLWLPGDEPVDPTPPELASRIKQVKQQLTWDDSWVWGGLDNEHKLTDAYEIVDEFIELHPYNLEILESYVGADLAEQRARVEGDGRDWSSVAPDKVKWSGLSEYIRSNTYRDVETLQDLGFIPPSFSIRYYDQTSCFRDEIAYSAGKYCLSTSFQPSEYTFEQDPVVYAVNRQYHDSYMFVTDDIPQGVYTLSMNKRIWGGIHLAPQVFGVSDVDMVEGDPYDPLPDKSEHGYYLYVLPPGQYAIDVLVLRSGEKVDLPLTLTVVELPVWRP